MPFLLGLNGDYGLGAPMYYTMLHDVTREDLGGYFYRIPITAQRVSKVISRLSVYELLGLNVLNLLGAGVTGMPGKALRATSHRVFTAPDPVGTLPCP